MATITARIADDKKIEAQKLAKELGISLSSLINIRINKFLRTKSISTSISDTQWAFYEGKDSIEINEDIDTVINFLDDTLTKSSNG